MYKPVYFKEAEFASCTPVCSFVDMDEAFLRKLDAARKNAGFPFVLTSAYRSSKWEIEHGRTGTSSHTKGLAVDIRCTDGVKRVAIVRSLLHVGFNRIGIAPNFIHADLDNTKTNSIWLY